MVSSMIISGRLVNPHNHIIVSFYDLILCRKNKIKALFGYWTHCVFSCDAQAYESYLKSGKPLPTVKVDENYNEVSANGRMPATRTSLGNENRTMHNSYSESEVMNMSKHERASQLHKTGTLADNTNLSNAHNSHQNYHLLDCEEIWRVAPRPPHSAEVSIDR